MQYSSLVVLILLGVACNVVLEGAQLRILAGDNVGYASIIAIDSSTDNNFTVIRNDIQLYPGRKMLLGTTGTLSGIDCFIVATLNDTYWISLQYYRITDGEMIQKVPNFGMMSWYSSILADETQESHILVQGFINSAGSASYFVDITTGKATMISPYNDVDSGVFTYLNPTRIFSMTLHFNAIFYYDYTIPGDFHPVLDTNIEWGNGADVYGNNGKYWVLTPTSLLMCPAVVQSVCSEFMQLSLNLTLQFENTVARGITFDKTMQKLYFIADPQMLYTVDVQTKTIESIISLSQLFDKYPQVRNLVVL